MQEAIEIQQKQVTSTDPVERIGTAANVPDDDSLRILQSVGTTVLLRFHCRILEYCQGMVGTEKEKWATLKKAKEELAQVTTVAVQDVFHFYARCDKFRKNMDDFADAPEDQRLHAIGTVARANPMLAYGSTLEEISLLHPESITLDTNTEDIPWNFKKAAREMFRLKQAFPEEGHFLLPDSTPLDNLEMIKIGLGPDPPDLTQTPIVGDPGFICQL